MNKNSGHIALIFTVLVWGSTFVVTKAALADIGPFSLISLRFLIAFAVLWPMAGRKGYRLCDSTRSQYLGLGFAGVALYFSLESWGLFYSSAVAAVLVIASAPAVTAAMAAVMLHERLRPSQWGGIALALLGAAVVAISGTGNTVGSRPLLGSALIFGAVLAWGAYTVQGKRLVSSQPAIVVTTAGIGAGLCMLLPLAVVETLTNGFPSLTVAPALSLLYLGVICSGLTMVLWNYALTKVDAGVAGTFINLVPVVGVLIAVLAGESISTWQILGGMVTLVGVWLSACRRRDRSRAAAQLSPI